MAYFSQHVSNQSTYQAAEPNNNFDQTQPDEYFPQAVRNGTLEGVVCNIFPARTFHYADNREGLVQSFIVVDMLVKNLGAAIHRNKITTWNALVENLNVKKSSFSKYNLKLALSEKYVSGARTV